MLWKTHIRIGIEVLRELGITLSPEVFQSFKNGIVAPDKWKDYPHQYATSEKIKANLLKSRAYFLRDDLQNAFFYLGVAFHYIQDSYTSLASSYPKHHRWEESIEYSNFTDDLKGTITYSLRNNLYERDRCLRLADALSKKSQGKNNTLYKATLTGYQASESYAHPLVDLNLGLRASYVVAESVLSPKGSPELVIALNEILKAHEGQLQNSEVGLSEKIVELVRKRDSLKSRIIAAPGIKAKLRNGFLKVAVGIRNMQVNSKSGEYDSQGHLRRVAEAYEEVCESVTNQYAGWYYFKVPELRFDLVEKELLLIQDVAKKLGFDESEFRKILQDANCLSYRVRNKELLKSSELNRVLKANPIRDFTEFPK